MPVRHDIWRMVKSAKNGSHKSKSRSATGSEIYGRTREGLAIAKPAFKPKSFSVSELERVMRDVKREEAARRAG
jgi:hypothetical protein